MRKFGVAIFPDERAASNGCRALKELTERGTTIEASVVVCKHANGNISVLDRSGKESHLTAVAAMIGGLAGLPAGPACGRHGSDRWCFDRTLRGADQSRS